MIIEYDEVVASEKRHSARQANLIEAAVALVNSCDGRLPADSSDSVLVECVHIRRIRMALQNL